jgi:hypothetical protein
MGRGENENQERDGMWLAQLFEGSIGMRSLEPVAHYYSLPIVALPLWRRL